MSENLHTKHKPIVDLRKGETIQDFYLVKSVSLKTTNAHNKYLDFVLGDNTGEINAKCWDYKEDKHGVYEEGEIIKVKALVTEWQGQLQLKIELIRKSRPEDGINENDYVQAAPHPAEEMLGEILKYVIKIQNNDIKEIVSAYINENREKLMYYPAAMKNHHSIRSGLLYHILTMLRLADKMMDIYTFLNPDLLYAGVIIHDMAKVDEMDSNELGMVKEYTTEGMLLGHIIQGIKSIERIGNEVGADPEIVMLLEHMILSHHYEPEYGSPKRPMIPEGEILHFLDIIDARMYDMQNALSYIDKGEFSEKIWLLHNRRIYKTKFDNEDDEECNIS